MIALVGLSFRDPGPLAALLPRTTWIEAFAAALVVAAGSLLVMFLGLRIPAVRDLERWQVLLVQEWSLTDVVAVAVLSGLCEEALLRALAVPWIGVVPAALLFAALHLVPDRRLWAWPVIAFAMGLVMGLLFEKWGYPAAAIAHILVNLLSLLRLVRKSRAATELPL